MKADTEFAATLLAAARPPAGASDAFVDALLAKRMSREAIRRYALALFAIAAAFPRRLAEILTLCDESEVRYSLLANLLEEEGVIGYDTAGGVRVARDCSHAELARRFVRAAGASEAEMRDAETSVRGGRWFASAIDRGDWIGAFAYLAVGHEANVPDTFRRIVPALVEQYGFSIDDLVFFTEHYEADERHGTESAHLIARIARTEDARGRALEGARRGGAAWRAWPRTIIGLDLVGASA